MKAADLRDIVGRPVDVAVATGYMTLDQRNGSDTAAGALRARVLAVRQDRVIPPRGRSLGVDHAANGVQVRFLDPFDGGSSLYSRNRRPDGTYVIDPGRIIDTWERYQQRLTEQTDRRAREAAQRDQARQEREALRVRAGTLAEQLGGRVTTDWDGTPQVSFTVEQAQRISDQLPDTTR